MSNISNIAPMTDRAIDHSYKMYQEAVKIKGTFNQYFNPSLLGVVLLVWLTEWILIIEYIFGEWWRTNVLFPQRLTLGLLVCVFYWLYLWGMAVWRRTQYGKFTRGERKLWAKAITAFWVAELVTIASFILIYLWLSWGPAPLVPRRFLMSRKGIIVELIIYTYLLFLAYVAKFSLRWNLWQFQLTLSLIIVIIFSYLLWKDIILLLLRDNPYNNSTAKWRHLRCAAVVNALSYEWWTTHAIAARAPYSRYPDLVIALTTHLHPFKPAVPLLTEYQDSNFLSAITFKQRANTIYPLLGNLIDYSTQYSSLNPNYLSDCFYPRRLGFLPKRFALWQILMVLKMWHHLIILLWWTLYSYKLVIRKKTSYSILNVCYFNVYCCYILALIVYFTYLVSFLELYLKLRPNMFGSHRALLLLEYALTYNYRLIFDSMPGDYIRKELDGTFITQNWFPPLTDLSRWLKDKNHPTNWPRIEELPI